MEDPGLEIVREVHRKEAERLRAAGQWPPPEAPSIPHMELPELQPDNPVFRPWNKYRQVVADLLAKGFEGFWLVIRDDEILGIYPAARLALAAVSAESAETLERTLIKQLLEHEPVSTLESLKSRCTGTPFPLAKTA